MAIATVAVLVTPSPRNSAAVVPSRVPPRVYTPYPTRRLTRPMAVRADAEAASRSRLPFFRARRERS